MYVGHLWAHLWPMNFYLYCYISTDVLCFVFNSSCPEFVIAPSKFIFNSCLTGQAFPLD